MSKIVRVFGWLAAIAGLFFGVVALMAGSAFNPLSLMFGLAYLLGGFFVLALCTTVADTSDLTAAIAERLQLEEVS